MGEVEAILKEIYGGLGRLDHESIVQRAVDVGAPVDVVRALFALPVGDYSLAEAMAAAAKVPSEPQHRVPATDLDIDDLTRELDSLYQTRHATLRHGSDQALEEHTRRTSELEEEYLRRFPEREVDPERLRQGARERP